MRRQGEKAVIAVIAYSAQFSHPLTFSEIYERLLTDRGIQSIDQSFISAKPLWKNTPLAAKEQIAAILHSLVKKGILIEQGRFFTLKGKQRAFQKRHASVSSRRAKKELVKEFVGIARKIPWVLGIALTGSFAAGGSGAADDVDFLIITRVNRLWLTRLLLLLQSWQRGRRPHLPGGDISHSWDLNLWLDETRLALPKRQQSVYEAYEILQIQWVHSRSNIRDRFLLANPWVSEYLSFWPGSALKYFAFQLPKIDLLAFADKAVFALQIGYRRLRHGRQRVDFHSAFFHPSHTRQNIFQAWKRLYKKAL